MIDLKDYNEYLELYKDDLVKNIRVMINKFDNFEYAEDGFEDTREYNNFKEFMNKFSLWTKMTKLQFDKLKHNES